MISTATQTISPTGKLTKATTIPTRIPPRVAPTSGIRSKNPNRIASGSANGTPRIRRVTYVTSPARMLITKLPNT